MCKYLTPNSSRTSKGTNNTMVIHVRLYTETTGYTGAFCNKNVKACNYIWKSECCLAYKQQLKLQIECVKCTNATKEK